MATYFAQIEDNKVTQVIVADQSFVDSIGGTWVETFMEGGKHFHYAGIGYNWDGTGFYAPQCHPEATLNTTTYLWDCTNADHTIKPLEAPNV